MRMYERASMFFHDVSYPRFFGSAAHLTISVDSYSYVHFLDFTRDNYRGIYDWANDTSYCGASHSFDVFLQEHVVKPLSREETALILREVITKHQYIYKDWAYIHLDLLAKILEITNLQEFLPPVVEELFKRRMEE